MFIGYNPPVKQGFESMNNANYYNIPSFYNPFVIRKWSRIIVDDILKFNDDIEIIYFSNREDVLCSEIIANLLTKHVIIKRYDYYQSYLKLKIWDIRVIVGPVWSLPLKARLSWWRAKKPVFDDEKIEVVPLKITRQRVDEIITSDCLVLLDYYSDKYYDLLVSVVAQLRNLGFSVYVKGHPRINHKININEVIVIDANKRLTEIDMAFHAVFSFMSAANLDVKARFSLYGYGLKRNMLKEARRLDFQNYVGADHTVLTKINEIEEIIGHNNLL